MAKRPSSAKQTEIIITDGAVVVPMTPQLKRKIEACIKKSGSVKIGFEEISITKVPGTGTASVVSD